MRYSLLAFFLFALPVQANPDTQEDYVVMQRAQIDNMLAKLDKLPEWKNCCQIVRKQIFDYYRDEDPEVYVSKLWLNAANDALRPQPECGSAVFFVAANPDDDAAAALALARQSKKASCPCGCAVTGQCDCASCSLRKTKGIGYAAACKQAVAENVPLVVFVGVRNRQVRAYGPIGCYSATLTGYTAPCIVVCVPDGKGWLQWRATLPASATNADILKVLTPPPPPQTMLRFAPSGMVSC
jgi:hypothetical protein